MGGIERVLTLCLLDTEAEPLRVIWVMVIRSKNLKINKTLVAM